jgi:hypothetical protein
MRRGGVSIVVAGLVALLGGPSLALAEGTSCGFPTVIVPDGRIVQSFIPNGSTYYWLFDSTNGNSYSLETKLTTGAWGNNLTIEYYDLGSSSCTTPITVTGTTGEDPEIPQTGERVSVTAASGSPGTRHWIEITNNTGSGQGYTVSVSDTTMYSPAWSTNGTYNTYYSFFNTTKGTVNVTISLTQTDGTPDSSTTVGVPSGQTAATNTVALGTTRDKTGTAKMTHDGPPGAILVEADIANFSLSPPYIQPVKFQSAREIR